jgi:hypothetical protein
MMSYHFQVVDWNDPNGQPLSESFHDTMPEALDEFTKQLVQATHDNPSLTVEPTLSSVTGDYEVAIFIDNPGGDADEYRWTITDEGGDE